MAVALKRSATTRARTTAIAERSSTRRAAGGRVPAIDALRGIALLMMFVYHLAFDLRYYGVLAADFENGAFWLGFRALIVASFLTIVGISLVLADGQGTSTRRFLRRIGIIAAAALAVSAASWLVFPASFIYFGILHGIAVASLLAWPVRRQPWLASVIAATVLIAGLAWSSAWFDQPIWSWVGFMTHKPVTEDYVPLAPWSAAVFAGIAIGHALARTQFGALRVVQPAPAWLEWLGRHSLAVYLLHQPLFLAVLWLLFSH